MNSEMIFAYAVHGINSSQVFWFFGLVWCNFIWVLWSEICVLEQNTDIWSWTAGVEAIHPYVIHSMYDEAKFINAGLSG